jgi:hypothetical protein
MAEVINVASQRAPMSKKRVAFKNVAEPRLANALQALEYLAMCADRTRYEIYDGDVALIRERLTAAVQDVISRYETGRRKPVVKFD